MDNRRRGMNRVGVILRDELGDATRPHAHDKSNELEQSTAGAKQAVTRIGEQDDERDAEMSAARVMTSRTSERSILI